MSTHANATAVKTTGTKSTRSARRSRPRRRGGVTMRIGGRSVIVPIGRRLTVCGEELEEKLRLEREGITFPAPSRISLRPSKDLSKVGPREAIEASHRRFNVPLRSGITCNPAPAAGQAQEKAVTAGTGEDIPVKEKSKTVKTAKTPKTAKSAMDAMIKQEIAEAKFSALEGEVSGLRLALDSVMTASATLAKCRAGIAPGACKNAPDVITAASDLDQRLRELIASASAARNTCLNTIRRNSNE